LTIFDIYVPSLNIIFEYYGYQHYQDHFLFGDVISRKEQDNNRRLACAYNNITYFEVPYWWQHDKESIIAILHHLRPDTVPEAPITTPFHYQIKTKLNQAVIIPQLK